MMGVYDASRNWSRVIKRQLKKEKLTLPQIKDKLDEIVSSELSRSKDCLIEGDSNIFFSDEPFYDRDDDRDGYLETIRYGGGKLIFPFMKERNYSRLYNEIRIKIPSELKFLDNLFGRVHSVPKGDPQLYFTAYHYQDGKDVQTKSASVYSSIRDILESEELISMIGKELSTIHEDKLHKYASLKTRESPEIAEIERKIKQSSQLSDEQKIEIANLEKDREKTYNELYEKNLREMRG